MKKIILPFLFLSIGLLVLSCGGGSKKTRIVQNFNEDWKFKLDSVNDFSKTDVNDADWRTLNLPHDWSIEGEFSETNPATVGGGALPGGIGWYRKSFKLDESYKNKVVFIDFDGVYMNSEVWINGVYLGKRPNGYISFRYELTQHLQLGDKENVIVVKVDNSQQPNSRWYSGSGIYRNVRLVAADKLHIDQWGTYITTPEASAKSSKVNVKTTIKNADVQSRNFKLITTLYDVSGKKLAESISDESIDKEAVKTVVHEMQLTNPTLWGIDNPYLYTAVSKIEYEGKVSDEYETLFGVRFFEFDSAKGFSLNGEAMKIKGVCLHHDLGSLGAAFNIRAMERQLEILKAMGCNGIRTSHNPPAPELLELCDKMGFLVMDETFDMWKKKKTTYDYSLYWDEWHKRDLQDHILRDRNHPSVFVWSIGNEILEQWDSTGTAIATELAQIVRELDNTRLITTANNGPTPQNFIIKSGALDLIGYNYNHTIFDSFPKHFPNLKFIGTETGSALATRGSYDMPSDSIRRWPIRWDLPFTTGNKDNSCSAYDNCSAPWGSTHEETWKLIKKHDFLSGMFYWTGFDYLGEPTPYSWPSKSSYFGIVDLAGFPKDAYYFYQSEWTNTPVLHIFPHWNWTEGDSIDVWAYTNCQKVELFLNGKSLGMKEKTGDLLHLQWRVAFTAGTLKAVGTLADGKTLTKEIKTASNAAKMSLTADRQKIKADGSDLSFITVDILDKDGNLVPRADNLVNFSIEGNGTIVAVDNGSPTSHEPFKASMRKAFNGKCLVIVQSKKQAGTIKLKATSEGIESQEISIVVE